MDYELYIDVLFLVEFISDCLILSLTALAQKRRTSAMRIAAAAALGAAFSCLTAVFPVLPPLLELAVAVFGAGTLMAVAAFGVRPVKELIKTDFALLMSALALGGTLMTLQQFLPLAGWEALFCLCAVYCAVRILLRLQKDRACRGKERYPVRLYYKGNTKEFLALADSGNRLREPISQKPVSVIAAGDCKDLCEKVSAVLYIPYRSVGTEAGLIPGIVFDKMEILKNGEWQTAEKPIIAVTKERLSQDGDFSLLLPEELVL